MKRASTLFLRLAVIDLAVITLAICVFALPALWMGVAKEYSADVAYVFYCILIAMYLSAIPFFMALHQAWRLLGYLDKGKAFSILSVKALKRIAWCAVAISVIYVASMPFFYLWADIDDAPGLVVISMAFVGAPLVIAVFAAVLQRLFKEAYT